MRCMNYMQGNSDHILFIKREGEKISILLVYVDDIVITSDDKIKISKLRKGFKRSLISKILENFGTS